MNKHVFYSLRNGTNTNSKGFTFQDFLGLFLRLYNELLAEGYFDEAFGFECIDLGFCKGNIRDIEFEILMSIRKHNLYPINEHIYSYSQCDLFDMIEFLYQHVSKPIKGNYHSFRECGMHWEEFNKKEGQQYFLEKINSLLELYKEKYELSEDGKILIKTEQGLESIFTADIPTKDEKIKEKLTLAINQFRGHSSTWYERRQAVRELADILEKLRKDIKKYLGSKDDNDLFNIANNFEIRHFNDKQKGEYDIVWLTWMFYFYLSTIHTVLRKKEIGSIKD